MGFRVQGHFLGVLTGRTISDTVQTPLRACLGDCEYSRNY